MHNFIEYLGYLTYIYGVNVHALKILYLKYEI